MRTDDADITQPPAKKKPGPKPKTEIKQEFPQRVYKNQRTIHHDLYKLEMASFLKNIALPEEIEDWRKVEHCHFFHTVDSSGKKQEYCSPVGGHFHKIEIQPNPDGGPPLIKTVSGPLKFVRRKVRGKWQKEIAPVNDQDNHTHDVIYLRSDDIPLRQTNLEATSAIVQVAQRTAPIPGVIG